MHLNHFDINEAIILLNFVNFVIKFFYLYYGKRDSKFFITYESFYQFFYSSYLEIIKLILINYTNTFFFVFNT